MESSSKFLEPNRNINVLVLVDSEVENSGRRSFWKEACSKFGDKFAVLERSLTEKHMAGLHVELDPDRWDIVVLNWDVADGDPKFSSHQTKEIIAYHYQDDIREFARAGGIVLVEAQTSYWSPDQSAYDTILGVGEVKIGPDGRFAPSGSTASSGESHSAHPLIIDLPKNLTGSFVSEPGTNWFPPDSVNFKVIERNDPNKLYAGFFKSWNATWLPLIYAENSHPIMLVKSVGHGFIVATTMFLASSDCSPLIRSLFIDGLRERLYIGRYHNKARIRRILNWALLPFAILASIVLAIYVASLFGATPLQLALAGLTGFIIPTAWNFIYRRFISKPLKAWTDRLFNK